MAEKTMQQALRSELKTRWAGLYGRTRRNQHICQTRYDLKVVIDLAAMGIAGEYTSTITTGTIDCIRLEDY